ncbi:LOW QUALITY PROTEIN: integral membrane protein, partial [Streptomyces sp. e14]
SPSRACSCRSARWRRGRRTASRTPAATSPPWRRSFFDPDVRDAIAQTVGDGITQEIGHQMDASVLRGTVAPFVHDAVRSFTQTAAFRTAWDEGNRVAHDALLRALRDERDAHDRPVTVDLAPVTAQVKARLAEDHVPLATRIPVEHTEVALLPAQQV